MEVLGLFAELFTRTDAPLIMKEFMTSMVEQMWSFGFFKMEGGGCNVTINRCSDKKITRLGS